jgi:hypothetical protein
VSFDHSPHHVAQIVGLDGVELGQGRSAAGLPRLTLLSGGELPEDLVASATIEDLEAADASLSADIEALVTGKGWNPYSHQGRHELLTRWQLSSSERKVEEWGRFKLASTIAARQRAEAEAAREIRLAQGIVLEHDLSAATIETLVKQGFVSAGADQDEAELTAVVFRVLEARFDHHAE